MIPAKSWSPPPILGDGFSIFSQKAVGALNKIIDESQSEILLTTSHKHRFTIEQWISIFEKRGVNINGINRLPYNANNLNRLEEINNWFASKQDTKDFVIIDDDTSLNGLSKYLKARLVLTKSLIGLNASHVQDALKILNTPMQLV